MLSSVGMIVLILTVGDLYTTVVKLSNLRFILNYKFNQGSGIYYRALAMTLWYKYQLRVCAAAGALMLFGVFAVFLFHRPWANSLILISISIIACFRVFIYFRLKHCVQMSNDLWRARGEAEAAKRKSQQE
jgi:hypothetical protein